MVQSKWLLNRNVFCSYCSSENFYTPDNIFSMFRGNVAWACRRRLVSIGSTNVAALYWEDTPEKRKPHPDMVYKHTVRQDVSAVGDGISLSKNRFFGVSWGTGNPCGCPTRGRHKASPYIWCQPPEFPKTQNNGSWRFCEIGIKPVKHKPYFRRVYAQEDCQLADLSQHSFEIPIGF